MRIAFIDIAAAYHAASPAEAALGGTQSAVCYLAVELAKKGVSVTLINQRRGEDVHLDVAHAPPERLDQPDFLKTFDAIIIVGRWTIKLATGFRQRARRDAPLIGWMHEASFQIPYAVPAPEFSAFIFVSQWQQRLNAPVMPPHAKSQVIGNAIAPAFHGLFEKSAAIRTAKTTPPVAAYSGSSKRGLLYLPEIIPALCREIPGLVFEIYSDCAVSTDAAENRQNLARFRNIPGVAFAGPVPQAELAQRLKRASFFISPNDYPESFCIALAESMAAGLACIATARAALPETAAGFAALAPAANPDATDYVEDSLDVKNFCRIAAARMRQGLEEQALREQIAYATTHYRWEKRAAEWIRFLGF